jgi:hypothetical protein
MAGNPIGVEVVGKFESELADDDFINLFRRVTVIFGLFVWRV